MVPALKLTIYYLILAEGIHSIQARPILAIRSRRQVVQPKWLFRPATFSDSKVRVTDENLKEAAAIRESIQKAVNSGTFAVDTDETDTNQTERVPMANSPERPKKPQPTFPPFQFPKFSMSQWNFQFFSVDQQNRFNEEMRRLWEEFLVNSRKFMRFSA